MICAVSFGQLGASLDTRDVIVGAVEEVVQIAEAKGIRIPGENYGAAVIKTCESLGTGLSSMLQDFRGGKRIEIDALNGAVVRLGKELGIPTPYNATLYATAKLLSQSGAKPR